MKQWWNNLQERERLALYIAMGCVFFYGFYLLIYAPLSNNVTNKTNLLREQQATLLWMQDMQKQYQASTHKLTNNKQNLSIISKELKQSSLNKSAAELQQTGNDAIQLSFTKVPYTTFIDWLKNLTQQHNFLIHKLHIEKTPDPGIVSALVIL